MKSLWILLVACGVMAASSAGCSPGLESTSISRSQPTSVLIVTSSAPVAGNNAAVESTPAPTKTFQINTTLAPQPGEQEQTMKNATPIPIPDDPYLARLVQQARDDLAMRLGIPSEQIDLVEFKQVEWPDGSLGCPQPGMAYTQVMVDGLLIRFQAGGSVYEYHSGGNRSPFLCKNPR